MRSGKVLTALFADVVGSTALGERLDAEDVKLVVGEAVARIVGEIEALGGRVKDLAGDGVLAFFGAPTTREDDAERAVRAALRIVGEMEDYAREVLRGWGIEGFGVRVGAATGSVVVGEVGGGERVEYAAFGDTVNLAARLQSAADSRARCSSTTRRIALSSNCSPGRTLELELKGKTEPVRAWPVAGLQAGPRRQWRSRCRGAFSSGESSAWRARRSMLFPGFGRVRRPRRQRRPGYRQVAPARRAAHCRGSCRRSLAGGPVRLVRRVAAVLAVP